MSYRLSRILECDHYQQTSGRGLRSMEGVDFLSGPPELLEKGEKRVMKRVGSQGFSANTHSDNWR